MHSSFEPVPPISPIWAGSLALQDLDARLMRMQEQAMAAVRAGTTWRTAGEVARRAEVADAADPKLAPVSTTTVERWWRERQVPTLVLDGVQRFPDYAFDAQGRPLPVVTRVLQALHDSREASIAAWFESTCSMLGGHRPRELLLTEAERVVAAAHDEAVGPVHG